MSTCRGCDESQAAAKSHIIPKSFFRYMDDGVSSLVEITSRKGEFPKKRRVGYYDSTILCHECEKVFGPCDDYGQNVLLKRKTEQRPLKDHSRTVAFQMEDVNGIMFKRFLVSVLWRASVATIPQFSKVRLNSHESRAKAITWGGPFESSEEFAFIAMRYLDSEVSDLLLNPHRLRNAGVNFISLYFPGYVFWIKVDGRPMPKALCKFNIVYTNTLILIAQEMRGSKEYDLMLDMMKISKMSG